VSDTPYAFKIGDRVVLTRLGPDQPEGVVTRINGLKTYPWLYTVSVAFESGKDLTLGPACLLPASEKAGLPAATGCVPEPTPPYLHPAPVRAPLLAPDWAEEDLSEAALTEAVGDWERSVGYIESGYDYRNDLEEYQLDLFNRECIHAFVLGFARLKRQLPPHPAKRIASADQRFVDLTVAGDCIWSAQHYDPTAFWYYFRWPRY
jgi:hypothetical protein